MKVKTILISAVILLGVVSCMLLCGCSGDTSGIRSLTFKQDGKKTVVFAYTPEDFDFRGGRTPLILLLGDSAFTKKNVLAHIEACGLRELADRESCTVAAVNPSDGKAWTDADYPLLQAVAGSTRDSWFPGDSRKGGLSDGMFLSSHFRIYVFAEGSAAGFVQSKLDTPDADFLIRDYGMLCGGFAAGYVYAPGGLSKEAVEKGWASVCDSTRMFTDKDTSVACTCGTYAGYGITAVRKAYKAVSGRTIEFFEYVPRSLTSSDVSPLVVLFHGRGMHPDAYVYQSSWAKVASEKGFRMISIAGPYDKKFSTEIDDAITADTHELIAYYVNSHSIDAAKVYAAGFSMGAYRVLDLGMKYPETFAAIAPCDPVKSDGIVFQKAIPVFFLGGALDNYGIFPTENDWCGPLIENIALVNGCPAPAYDAVSNGVWGAVFDNDRCVTDPDTGLTLNLHECRNAEGNVKAVFCDVTGMGHSVLPKSSEVIWEFFEQQSKNGNP